MLYLATSQRFNLPEDQLWLSLMDIDGVLDADRKSCLSGDAYSRTDGRFAVLSPGLQDSIGHTYYGRRLREIPMYVNEPYLLD